MSPLSQKRHPNISVLCALLTAKLGARRGGVHFVMFSRFAPTAFSTHCVLWTTAKSPLMGLNGCSNRSVDVAVGNNEKRSSRKPRACCNWCEHPRVRRGHAGEGTAPVCSRSAVQLVRTLCRWEFRRGVDQWQSEHSRQQLQRRAHRVYCGCPGWL